MQKIYKIVNALKLERKEKLLYNYQRGGNSEKIINDYITGSLFGWLWK